VVAKTLAANGGDPGTSPDAALALCTTSERRGRGLQENVLAELNLALIRGEVVVALALLAHHALLALVVDAAEVVVVVPNVVRLFVLLAAVPRVDPLADRVRHARHRRLPVAGRGRRAVRDGLHRHHRGAVGSRV
jgi:hypothetical protein